MLDENEIKCIHWDSHIQNRLIGRGTPYPTIRILVEEIIYIQNQIKEIKRLYESDKTDILIKQNVSTIGIEELGYKTNLLILQNKLDEAYYSLNRFRNVSNQIPGLCGQVNCILDYIIHGVRWIDVEIRTNTIAQRMNKENCIAYVNEANKLIGIRYHYE